MSRRIACTVRLLDKSEPELDAPEEEVFGIDFGWNGTHYYRMDTGKLCCMNVSPNLYYCTRPEGHGGPHYAADADDQPAWE